MDRVDGVPYTTAKAFERALSDAGRVEAEVSTSDS